MTAKNRVTQIGKLHSALKKHFKPAPPSPGRPLLEHVLYACLLEDTPADLADEGFAKCEQEFFDWNEVRVTTVTELAEVLSRLPQAQAAAVRLKKNLQSLFETFYNFDIDFLKKENLGKAVAKLESLPGMTPFVLSYVTQHGLGGHAIPVDKSAMKIMWLSGIVSDAEAETGRVPGLERTIPKNRAIEFSSLLHQAGVSFQTNPKDKAVWDVLLATNKDAKALFERPPAPAPAKKSTKASAAPAAAKDAPAAAPAKGGKAALPAPTVVTDSAGSKKGPKATPVKPTPGKPEEAAEKAAAKPTSKPKADAAASKPDTKGDAKAKKPLAKEPSAKPAAVKPATVKEPAKSEKKSATAQPATASAAPKAAAKPAPGKPLSAKATSPDKASSVDKAASSTKKPSSKAAPEPAKPAAKKTASEKAAVEKPASKKEQPPAKPASKKAEAKPASKKAADKLIPAKKAATSTNKKLTKQKPR